MIWPILDLCHIFVKTWQLTRFGEIFHLYIMPGGRSGTFLNSDFHMEYNHGHPGSRDTGLNYTPATLFTSPCLVQGVTPGPLLYRSARDQGVDPGTLSRLGARGQGETPCPLASSKARVPGSLPVPSRGHPPARVSLLFYSYWHPAP